MTFICILAQGPANVKGGLGERHFHSCNIVQVPAPSAGVRDPLIRPLYFTDGGTLMVVCKPKPNRNVVFKPKPNHNVVCKPKPNRNVVCIDQEMEAPEAGRVACSLHSAGGLPGPLLQTVHSS